MAGTAPLTVTFTDQSTALAGVIRPWTWNFGDGVASTGTYTNTLTQTGFIVVGPTHRTVINYTYDGLYRLTKADSTSAMTTTFQYAYDSVGNRTAQTATITSTQVTVYQYDTANRLPNVGV